MGFDVEPYTTNVIWLHLGLLFVGVAVTDSTKLSCTPLTKRNKLKLIKEGAVSDIMQVVLHCLIYWIFIG